METTIKFAKIHPNAVIPSKREEDMGFDVYACFDEDLMVVSPHETKIIPTGIAYSIDSNYGLIVKERSSTGSKGMAVRMGVLDAGYRGEVLIGITNTTNQVIVISKLAQKEVDQKLNEVMGLLPLAHYILNDSYTLYPYEKAIAQIIVVPVPKTNLKVVSYNELCAIQSERGTGALGSSNK